MNRFSFVARRSVVAAYDLAALSLLCFLPLACLPGRAYAYVDPSVMTYTIQALAGVAVALSAVAGVALRKTRKKLFKLLKIDENAGKEVDPAWSRQGVGVSGFLVEELAEESAEANTGGAGGRQSVLLPKRSADKPSWKKRFVLSLIAVGFCGFTLGIATPFEIVAGNAESLLFGVGDIWLIMLGFVLAVTLVLALLLSLVPGKAFTPLLVLVFCGGLCCYVQAMFLNVGLPAANGDTFDCWQDHRFMTVLSLVVWTVLLIVPPILSFKDRHKAQLGVAALSVCLVLVQGVGVASLCISAAQNDVDSSDVVQATEDGLFEVSEQSNVIVFVLDHSDNKLLNSMLESNPDLLADFTGFTRYDNSVGMMVPTLYAMPYLLTAEVPAAGEDIDAYHNERYARSTFMEDLASTGYSIGLYTQEFGFDYLSADEVHSEIADYTVNLHGVESFNINEMGAIKAMVKCSLYRDLPWVFKRRWWFYTDEINIKAIDYGADTLPEDTLYTLDDPRYFERLQQYGLSVEEGYDGAFRLIHLSGPHVPYTMDENAQYVGVDNSTIEQQAAGSLKIVAYYISLLKDMGLYDGATIIVTSDHGDWSPSEGLPTYPISPMMLVKEPCTLEQSEQPIMVSSSPVGHVDFHATVLEAMGADGSKYGAPISEVFDELRVRDMYMIIHNTVYVNEIVKYEITGHALDFASWEYTGESWHVSD